MSNERECDSPFTSMLNVCIQEVQHLVHAIRCHSEGTQAISFKLSRLHTVDVHSLILPPY